MADLYKSMYVGVGNVYHFPDDGDGKLWEARQGPAGTVEVWVHSPDGVARYFQSVLNANISTVHGELA